MVILYMWLIIHFWQIYVHCCFWFNWKSCQIVWLSIYGHIYPLTYRHDLTIVYHQHFFLFSNSQIVNMIQYIRPTQHISYVQCVKTLNNTCSHCGPCFRVFTPVCGPINNCFESGRTFYADWCVNIIIHTWAFPVLIYRFHNRAEAYFVNDNGCPTSLRGSARGIPVLWCG